HLDATPERRIMRADAHVERAHVTVKGHVLDAVNLRDQTQVTLTGDPRLGQVSVEQEIALDALEQDYVPAYPVGGLKLTVQANRDADGTIPVEKVRAENAKGGTTAEVTGNLELVRGRSRAAVIGHKGLALHGVVDQRLEALGGATHLV